MKLHSFLQLSEGGLAVSEQYWREVGEPAVDEAFPEYKNRIAYGLVGEGSECWGFDDLISTDHDYGPSFCMWLTREDYDAIGEALQACYDRLPGEFKGHPARAVRPNAGKRTGAFFIGDFYSRFLGRPGGPELLTDWLYIPDEYFSVATNGKVFADPLGEFSKIRSRLLAHYPEDVFLKKLAARVLTMAQSGQANYPRCMRRGDIVSAGGAVSKFIDSAVSVIYLLNRRYAPYYKWRFRGLYELDVLKELADKLEELASLGSTLDTWTKEIILDLSALNRKDPKAELMEEISICVNRELRNQGLCRTDEPFLESSAFEIYEKIRDPQLRSMHILQG